MEKPVRIAINGFGRIGRTAFRAGYKRKELEFVAFNDLTDTKTLAHLTQYDSIYGTLSEKVEFDEKNLNVAGKKIPVLAEKDPTKLPWKEMEVDIVLECTGFFTEREGADGHIKAGAKKVVISAPTKSEDIPTYIIGANEDKITGDEDIISNASCTTNCIAPIAKIISDEIGVEKSMMTTTHSYTSSQVLVDGPTDDLRRARAAALNIVPTTTGAATAAALAVPELKGLFDGLSVRVPTPIVSLSDFVFLTKKDVTPEEVNEIIRKKSSEERYQRIVRLEENELVSTDLIGDTHSSIVDAPLTMVVDKNLLKVVAWYDNEYGYSNRLVDIAILLAKKADL